MCGYLLKKWWATNARSSCPDVKPDTGIFPFHFHCATWHMNLFLLFSKNGVILHCLNICPDWLLENLFSAWLAILYSSGRLLFHLSGCPRAHSKGTIIRKCTHHANLWAIMAEPGAPFADWHTNNMTTHWSGVQLCLVACKICSVYNVFFSQLVFANGFGFSNGQNRWMWLWLRWNLSWMPCQRGIVVCDLCHSSSSAWYETKVPCSAHVQGGPQFNPKTLKSMFSVSMFCTCHLWFNRNITYY